MIKNYLKTAWRNIKKHPGFSLLNAGGLTLGLASCLLLMLYISYHLSFNHQFNNLENIYICENNQPGDGKIYTFTATPKVLAGTIKTEVPGVVQCVRTIDYTADGLVTYNNNSFKKAGLYADPGFFSMFSYHFIKGDPAKALTLPNSIVITQELAATVFGNADPMGKTITRNNQLPLMVTGVIENPPVNSNFQFDFVIPWVLFENANAWTKNSGWGSNFARTYVQLKGATDFDKANGLLKTIVARHSDGNKNEIFLFPLKKQHLYSKFENGQSVGGLIDQIHIFEILALCILLIACVNFMNLSTARSEERAKEVGIRKAIGSGRNSLIAQFITESLILSFVSTIAAVLIVICTVPSFDTLLNIKLSIPYSNGYMWILIIGLALFTGLISGSYPAFYLSSFQPIKVLKGMFKGGGSALPVRKVLVVVQFFCAVFLITATICIYRQIRFIQSLSNGYDKNNLVEVPIEGTLDKQSEVLINELKNTGAITAATPVSLSLTQSGNNTWGIDWPGKQKDQKVLIDIFNVGFDFIETTGGKLLDGREFSSKYTSIDTANKTAMVNESFAKLMHLKSAVGTIIHWGDQPFTIVGVYKDFVRASPYEKTPPAISTYAGSGAVAIAMRLNHNRSISANIEQLNKSLKAINPAYPPKINFVDKEFEKKFENEQTLAMLANLFGGLAIVISCLGLLGLAAYAAEQRVKEIGVRKVLGASVFNLVALLSKDFLILVTIAIAIAVPTSIWALNKWLINYEYHIHLRWWIMTLAGLITIMIALTTVSYQALKAALANPVKSLRSE